MRKRLLALLAIFMFILVPGACASDLAVTVDSQAVIFPDEKPFIDPESRIQAPIRYIMQMMDVNVEWDDVNRSAVMTKDDTTAIFTMDSPYYTVNGQSRVMDTTPMAIGSRMFFPIRFAVESFGAVVDFDVPNNTVRVVSSPASNPADNNSNYPLAINGLLPGQTLDDAKALFGEPDSSVEDPEASNIVIYKFGGLFVDVFNGSQVVAIRTESAAYSTGLGIKVGSTVPELWAAYGNPYPEPSSLLDPAYHNTYKHHYGYVNNTDTLPTELNVGTGYYHINFWCHGTQNNVQMIESSYGYR